MWRAALSILAASLALPASALDVGDLLGSAPIPIDVRVVNKEDGTLLISSGERLLAAMRLRTVEKSNTQELLSLEAAKAALSASKPLATEFSRQHAFPIASGTAVDLFTRAHPVSKGCRLLVTSSLHRGKDATQIEPLGTPPQQEMVVQFFPDPQGKTVHLTDLNDEPASAGAVDQKVWRARNLAFEANKEQRVKIERSGPCAWTMAQANGSLILTSRVLPDPHEPSLYGSFVVFVGTGHDADAPETSLIRLSNTVVPARDFIEGSARVYCSGADPFMLTDVAVLAEIALPPRNDGNVPTRNLPCYFWEPPEPDSAEGEYRFRFAPPAEGLYGVHIIVSTTNAKSISETIPFHALAPAGPGSAHVKTGQRQLRLDDNTLFAPVGCDLGRFTAQDGVAAFTSKFIELERNHGNAACLTISRAFPLEGPGAGKIDPKIAQELDDIFRSAQVRGIRLILALESGLDLGRNNSKHPYFIEQGGPLPSAPEFFRHPGARRFYQMRMAYAAARYGAYSSLLSWELMRNVDEAWPALKKDPANKKLDPQDVDISRRGRRDVEEWIELMAQQLHGLDQHNHPIGVSIALEPKEWLDLTRIEHLDWVLNRDFIEGNSVEAKLPNLEADFERWATAAREAGRARKPWAVCSFGAPLQSGTGLLAPLLNGVAAAPLISAAPEKAFSAEELGALRAAGVLSAALAEISAYDPADELPPTILPILSPETAKASTRIFARAGRRGAIVWLLRDASESIELKMPGMIEGRYTISWMNPADGSFFPESTHQAPPQQVGQALPTWTVQTPAFKGGLIGLIVRENRW